MSDKPPTVVLAIMQNQWFKDPARMRKMLDVAFNGNRPRFIRTFLFWSCLTGRRLTAAFGEDACDRIIWEEASPQMGGKASDRFPADYDHLRATLDRWRPSIVLAFGRIAADALRDIQRERSGAGELFAGGQPFCLFVAPHPAARHASVLAELRATAVALFSVVGDAGGIADVDTSNQPETVVINMRDANGVKQPLDPIAAKQIGEAMVVIKRAYLKERYEPRR